MNFYKYLISIIIVGYFSFAAFASYSDAVNGEFVTVSGKVTNVKRDSFRLKVNGNNIFVEMDDYDWDADGYKLVNGDQVVVSGRIDNDFLERKKIEAGSVYVKNLNTYFYASSDDEEGPPYLSTSYSFIPVLPDSAFVDLQGKVTNVNGREFTLDTGLRKITIDTDHMLYNPLDKVGYTKIQKGDRVRVSGTVDDNFFTGKDINASSIVELR